MRPFCFLQAVKDFLESALCSDLILVPFLNQRLVFWTNPQNSSGLAERAVSVNIALHQWADLADLRKKD